MSYRRVLWLVLGLLLGVLVGAAPPLPLTRDAGAAAAAQDTSGGPSLPRYSLQVNVEYEAAEVTVEQVTRFRNRTGQPLEGAVFQVATAASGAFQLEAAAAQGAPVAAALDGSVLEVPFPAALPHGAEAEVGLSYRLAVSRDPGRVTAGPSGLALGNWLPTLAPHRGDWERHQYSDIGDPFVTELADFDLHLTTSVPLIVATGGEVLADDGTRFHIRALGVRDLALSLAPDYQVAESRAGPTVVRAYTHDPERSRLFADTAARFLAWYGDRLGPYPYPTLALAEADLPPVWNGMEYPGLVFLSPQVAVRSPFETSSSEELIAHEMAHQWFYGLVGSDQVRDPWLDEAFAEYLPFHYYRQAHPERVQALWNERVASFLAERLRVTGDLPVDSPIAAFTSNSVYRTVVYHRGAVAVNELREAMGDEAFERALADYAAVFRGKLASPRAALDLFQRHTPANLNGVLAPHFSYDAFREPEPAAWRVTAPEGPWARQVAVTVQADFPLERVEIWLDGRRMYQGAAGSVTLDLRDVEPGEYVLLTRVWNDRGILFERAGRVAVADGP